MKLKQFLKEEFFTRIRSYEVFKNPSTQEIIDLIKQDSTMRGLADSKNKTIYIFSIDLLHYDAVTDLSKKIDDCLLITFEFYPKSKVLYLSGSYKIVKGNYTFVDNIPGRDVKWLLDKFSAWKPTIRKADRVVLKGKKQWMVEEHISNTKLSNWKHEQLLLFKNPTSDEVKELRDWKSALVRFIIDFSKKEVWVWPAWDILHKSVWEDVIGKSFDKTVIYRDYLLGSGEIKGNYIFYTDSDWIDSSYWNSEKGNYYKRVKSLQFIKRYDGKDSWTEKYFKPSPIIKVCKEKYGIET